MTPAAPIAVIGAGTMGAGIAQLAVTAGHSVFLYDACEGAAVQAKHRLQQQFETRVAAGKMSGAVLDAILPRLMPVSELSGVATCELVIEAIVESLAKKQELFTSLEQIVAAGTILASNTSSISISAIARSLRSRGRFIGMHFFNPVHAMRLVEVVSGLDTDPAVSDDVVALAQAWGKTAVVARSTPGFIVNRIARPFYAEALMLIQEQSATPDQIDRLARSAGFKMGPCELMDLIGHDVNLAVTETMFRAFYEDRRFTPSIVQRELVDAGRCGRKTSHGFYVYPRRLENQDAEFGLSRASATRAAQIVVRGGAPASQEWVRRFAQSGLPVSVQQEAVACIDVVLDDGGLISLYQTEGVCAAQLALDHPDALLAVFDLPLFGTERIVLGIAYPERVSVDRRVAVATLFDTIGVTLVEIADSPGLLVARTIVMLVNEAADAVQQGVCTREDADLAMKLGVNYPAGPFEWLEALGTGWIVATLGNLAKYYQGERYRVSPWLYNRRWHEA